MVSQRFNHPKFGGPDFWKELIEFHARLVRLLTYIQQSEDDMHLVRTNTLTVDGLAQAIVACDQHEGFDTSAVIHLITLYLLSTEQNE